MWKWLALIALRKLRKHLKLNADQSRFFDEFLKWLESYE